MVPFRPRCYWLPTIRIRGSVTVLLDRLYTAEYGINDAFDRSVMCMHVGKMLGGNSAFAHAFFCYLGSYMSENGGWKDDIVNQGHPGEKRDTRVRRPEVGIGFSGSFTGTRAGSDRAGSGIIAPPAST
jgi:hypothetical protein